VSVLLGAERFKFGKLCPSGYLGGNRLVNNFFAATASALRSLDGIRVFTKEI
jgi:hypothetical protein